MDPFGTCKEEEEESSLSTRGVIRPDAEARRQQDRLNDMIESEHESDVESLAGDMTRSFPNVPTGITHTHDNDSSDDEDDNDSDTKTTDNK